jgi:hypothetical protein
MEEDALLPNHWICTSPQHSHANWLAPFVPWLGRTAFQPSRQFVNHARGEDVMPTLAIR